ncbi:MAG: hypothetical protein OHK0057_27350 [Thermoflexibacter sp.]
MFSNTNNFSVIGSYFKVVLWFLMMILFANTSFAQSTLAIVSQEPTISSIANTLPGNQVFQFSITDIAGGNRTKFTGLVIEQGTGNDISDWTEIIEGANLSSGANDIDALTIGTNTITFSGINSANGQLGDVNQGVTKTYTLKIWLKSSLSATLQETVDGLNLVFRIQTSGFTMAGTSDPIATGQDISTSSTNIAVEVDATNMSFITQPSPTAIGVTELFSTSPVVQAEDANGNRDLDYVGAATVSNTGTLTMNNAPTMFASGLLTFPSNFYYSTDGNGTLEISSGSLTTATSDAVTVTSATVTPPSTLNVCANSGYFTLGDIDIKEGGIGDFEIGSNMALILNMPSGFELEAGTGTVSKVQGTDLGGSPFMIVSSTSLVVFYSVSGKTGSSSADLDHLRISGLKIKASASSTNKTILRDSNSSSVIYGVTGSTVFANMTATDVPTIISKNTTTSSPYCGTSPITLVGKIGGSATTGTWTKISGNGTLGSTTYDNVNDEWEAVYTPVAADYGNTVIFQFATDDPVGNCAAVSENLSFVISAPATATFATTTPTRNVTNVCSGDNGFVYEMTNSSSSYTWSISGTGNVQVTGGNSHSITVNWGNTAGGNFTVTATETTVDGCVGTPQVLNVTMGTPTSVSFSLLTTSYRTSDPDVNLTDDATYSPAGGVFSGNYVYFDPDTDKYYFRPSDATSGYTGTITYTVTSGGCQYSEDVTVTVINSFSCFQGLPFYNMCSAPNTPDLIVYYDDGDPGSTYSSISIGYISVPPGAFVVDGFYSPGRPKYIFKPSMLPENSDLYFQVNGLVTSASCLTFQWFRTFKNTLDISASYNSSSLEYCENDSDVTLTGSSSDGSTTLTFYCPDCGVTGLVDNGNGTATFKPSLAYANSGDNINPYDFYITMSKNDSCGTVTKKIRVYPQPAQPTIVTSIPNYCNGDILGNITVSGVANTFWEWSSNSSFSSIIFSETSTTTESTLSNPVILTSPGPSSSTLSYWVRQTKNGCESPARQIDITIFPTPITPTLISTIPSYCDGDVLQDIVVQGTTGAIWEWSTVSDFSTILTSGTTLGNQNTMDGSIVGTLSAPGPSSSIYTYYVRQKVNGCYSQTLTINVMVFPIPMTPELQGTIPNYCAGNTLGAITVRGNTGATWEWATASDFNSGALISTHTTSGDKNTLNYSPTLSVGTLNLYVRQTVSGCTSAVLTVTINTFPNPTANAGTDQQTCLGKDITLGVAGSTASGGSGAPFTYSWSPTTGLSNPFAETPILTPFGVGTYTYTVTIIDNKGCTATDQVQVEVKTALSADAGPDKEICPDGTTSLGATTAASGGGGTYFYSWTPATGLDDSSIANPSVTLSSGTQVYTLTVTDNLGCSSSDQVTVTVNPNPTAQAGNDVEVCAGTSVIIGGSPTAFGGSGSGYTYTWSPSTGLNSNSLPNPTLILNDAGSYTYTVTVTDSKGCSSSDQVVIVVLPRPVANAGADIEVCAGASVVLGTAGTVATGGSGGPYTYSWSPTVGLSNPVAETPTFNLTAPGIYTYTVTVTDSKGCTATDALTLDVKIVPIAFAGSDKDVCSGSSVTIGGSPSVIGGTAPYTYLWTPATGLDDPTISNPTATLTEEDGSSITYTLLVTDSKGCVDTDDIVVTINPLPTAQAGSDQEVCSGNIITLGGSPTAYGGAGGYSYEWSPETGLSSTSIANPQLELTFPGDYTYYLTVTDEEGCIARDTVEIVVYPNPIANAGEDTEVCVGSPVQLGGAVPASGGTGSSYTYSWTPSTGLDDATIGNPNLTLTSPGTYTYTLQVTDIKGCIATDQVVIVIHNSPTASAGEDKKICSGSSVIIGGSPTAVGGSETGYTYLWTPSDGLDNPNIPNPQVSLTEAGVYVYTVTVTDSEGCTDTDEMSLTVYSLPIANAGVDSRVCATLPLVIGGSPSAVGGSGGGYSYQWTPETGLSNPFVSNPTLILSSSGTYKYTLLITDGNGCQDTDEVTITVDELPIADAGTDKSICANSPVLLGGIQTARGGSGNYTYLWSPLDGVSNPNIANPTLTLSEAGNYTYNVLITDEKGCQDRDTISIRVLKLPVADAGPDKEVCDGSSVKIGGNPTASGGSGGGYTYFWTPFTGLDDPTIPNPTVTLSLSQKSVTYTLRVTDGNNCTVTDQVTVTVNPLPQLSISGFNSQLQYCVDAPDIRLQGIVNSAGTGFFKGTGIIEGTSIFSPALAGVGGPYKITYVFTNDKGCTDSTSVQVKVVSLPNPDFTGFNANREYCIDYASDIILTGIPAGVGGVFSGNGITNLENDPGKAIFRVSAAAAIANTPESQSSHIITFTYTDANGCVKSISKTVKINPLPKVGITGLKDNYCITDAPTVLRSNPLNPKGRFSGPGIIDNKDGTAVIDPSKITKEGEIVITYSLIDDNSCANSISLRSRVWARPGTRITNFTDLGLSNLFCNNSEAVRLIGDPTGGIFYLNNVSIGSTFNPADPMNPPGIYTLGYSYANAFGCDSIFTKQIVILPLPQVKFSYSSACEDKVIQFNNETFFKERVEGYPNQIATTEWDFGDNTISTLSNPTHIYEKEGIYKVKLTVTSFYGCKVSLEQNITVGQTPTVNFTWSNICLGEPVKFVSTGTFGSLSIAKQWEWDFGDGNTRIVTGNKGDTEYVYANYGTYNVKLTAVSDKDCRKDTTLKVSITPKVVGAYPYLETFNSGSGGWFTDPVGSTWEVGVPAQNSTIKPQAANDQCWTTNLDGPYLDKEKSYVYSPCFNLNGLQKPMLIFKYWSATASGIDGTTIEVTTDDKNWTRLGKKASGINWYNGASLPGNPGNQLVEQLGWTGVDNSWKEARHSLEPYKNASFIRFRFAFGVIDNSSKFDGFAFDDFWVGEREKIALIEHFTNVGAATFVQDEERLQKIQTDLPADLALINYYTDFPNTNDPVNGLNKAEPSARALYYGILQTPRTVMDGNDYKGVTSGLTTNNIDTISLEPVKLALSMDFSQTENSKFVVKVGVKALQNLNAQRLKLYLAVVNKSISVEGNIYKNILNRMVPNSTGTTIQSQWTKDSEQFYTLEWSAYSNRDINDIHVVAFIQDDVTREVFQTLVRVPDKFPQIITAVEDDLVEGKKLNLYPNPTNQLLKVTLPEKLSGELSWSISDVTGKIWLSGVGEKGSSNWILNVSSLPTGVYVLQVLKDGKGYAFEQFSVQH